MKSQFFRLFYSVIILLNFYNFTVYVIFLRVVLKKKFCTVFIRIQLFRPILYFSYVQYIYIVCYHNVLSVTRAIFSVSSFCIFIDNIFLYSFYFVNLVIQVNFIVSHVQFFYIILYHNVYPSHGQFF